MRGFLSEEERIAMEEHKNQSNGSPPANNRSGNIIDFLVEIDRIHTENDGKLTVEEIKLRIAVKISIDLWSISNKLMKLRNFLCELIKKIFHA